MPDTMVPATVEQPDTLAHRFRVAFITGAEFSEMPLGDQLVEGAKALAGMIEAGDFRRLPIATRCHLRGISMWMYGLGECVESASRAYATGTRDGATIEHNRILGLPWWRRALGRVG